MEKLSICRRMAEIDLPALMRVYTESCLTEGRKLQPSAPAGLCLQLGMDEFLDYLRRDFFTRPDAVYALLTEDGSYLSALRLEPWQDGLLLQGLETAPEHRGRGCAGRLIRAVQTACRSRIYSHVSRTNRPSLAVHKACGFTVYQDHARLLDGTVTGKFLTLLWDPEKEKNNT